jgi:hypothetical protein
VATLEEIAMKTLAKHLSIILVLVFTTQAQALETDSRLVNGVAVNLVVLDKCKGAIPDKARDAVYVMTTKVDKAQLLIAMVKADQDVTDLIRKLGIENFCAVMRGRLNWWK